MAAAIPGDPIEANEAAASPKASSSSPTQLASQDPYAIVGENPSPEEQQDPNAKAPVAEASIAEAPIAEEQITKQKHIKYITQLYMKKTIKTGKQARKHNKQ